MKRKKIVYIEDNQANLRFMKKVLQSRGDVELYCAEEAREGIDIVRRERPDIILMDIQMPGMDGYEAFALLQEDAATKSIPVIAVSANAMESDIKHALKIGFSAYLTKPVEIQLLFDTIDQF